MASASERYKIALNILARVGIDGNLHDEYARAMSTLNGLQTYNELNPPAPPVQNMAQGTQNAPVMEGNSPEMTPSTTEPPIV